MITVTGLTFVLKFLNYTIGYIIKVRVDIWEPGRFGENDNRILTLSGPDITKVLGCGKLNRQLFRNHT